MGNGEGGNREGGERGWVGNGRGAIWRVVKGATPSNLDRRLVLF